MHLSKLVVVCCLAMGSASAAFAQVESSNPQVVIVVSAAPIFAAPYESRLPVRTAKEQSRLRVVAATGDWYEVEYKDPDFGRKTGFIQKKNVASAVDPSASTKPVDLSVNDSAPAQAVTQPSGAPNGVSSISAPRNAIPQATERTSLSAMPEPPPTRQIPSTGGFVETDSKSTSSGFFVGFGFEGTGITDNDVTSAADSGLGGGVVIGYGFTPRWSLYGGLSGASISSSDLTDSYGLGHFDVGTRIHFLAGPHRVVPFVQGGLAGVARHKEFSIGSANHTLTQSGSGVEFGAGLNAHFTRELAFSTAVTWMVGDFRKQAFDGQNESIDAVGANSARIHVGVIWWH